MIITLCLGGFYSLADIASPDSHIRVSKEELEAANYTSLIFKNGTVGRL